MTYKPWTQPISSYHEWQLLRLKLVIYAMSKCSLQCKDIGVTELTKISTICTSRGSKTRQSQCERTTDFHTSKKSKHLDPSSTTRAKSTIKRQDNIYTSSSTSPVNPSLCWNRYNGWILEKKEKILFPGWGRRHSKSTVYSQRTPQFAAYQTSASAQKSRI